MCYCQGVARRFDSSPLGAIERTPSGGLRIPARLTRTGVFEYPTPTGLRREYRSPIEVFSPEVLTALRGATLTENHPHDGTIRADNWRDLSVGHVADDVREDGIFVAATVYVQDASTVSRIERRELTEVSVGYDTDYVPGAGVSPEGEAYDGLQTNIRPNHVALVPRGRAGRDVGLRLDAAGDQEIPESSRMRILIDGKEFDSGSPEAIAAAATSKARADAQDREVSRLRGAESRRIRGEARRVKAEFKTDADDNAVMLSVISKIAPDVDVSGASPDFVAGAFAVAIAIAMKAMALEDSPEEDPEADPMGATPPVSGAAAARADVFDGLRRSDSDTYTADDLREEAAEAQRNQHKGGR